MQQAIINLGILLLSIIWMLRDETDRSRPILVIAFVFNLAYGFALQFVMGTENGLVPWKYDPVLLRLDGALGLSYVPVAENFHFAVMPLFILYQLLVPMMAVWFLVARKNGEALSIVIAYVTEMVVGPLLYAIVPACGPVYAFRKAWLAPPSVEAVPIRLSGMPNAFPSLHVATALLFLLFARTRTTRLIAVLFLVLTMIATLALGEHYVIDWIAGMAFGCFAAAVGRGEWALVGFFGLSLGWPLAVRFGSKWLLAHPWALFAMVALTLVAVGRALYTASRPSPSKRNHLMTCLKTVRGWRLGEAGEP